MCITEAALLLFLSYLPDSIVHRPEPGRIIVEAEAGPAVWTRYPDTWCTQAPTAARLAVLSAGIGHGS